MTSWKVSKLSSLALIIIIWSTYDQAFESGAFESVPASNIIFVVFVSFALFIVWLVIAFTTANAWLPAKDVAAVCYCIPAKTPGKVVNNSDAARYTNIFDSYGGSTSSDNLCGPYATSI